MILLKFVSPGEIFLCHFAYVELVEIRVIFIENTNYFVLHYIIYGRALGPPVYYEFLKALLTQRRYTPEQAFPSEAVFVAQPYK